LLLVAYPISSLEMLSKQETATLVDSAPIARIGHWPEPFCYLNRHKDTKVSLEVVGETVKVSTNHPVKGLLLSVDGMWSGRIIC
jgi:hypothetical protein